MAEMKPRSWSRLHRPELDFDGPRRPLVGILDDQSKRVVVEKGVQVGLTDSIALNRALHFVATAQADVLYLFPTQAVAGEFSAGRFNPLIERSPYLRNLFTFVDSVHHKRAGQANFYIRGSNSESQLISVPVKFLVIDEFDRMDQSNLGLARDRLQGQKNNWELDISTPTFPGLGIDAEFQKTDKRRWCIECPNCKERRPLSWSSIEWKESDIEKSHWRCSSCAMPWTEKQKHEFVSRGSWIATAPERKVRGYHYPGLLSCVRTAPDFAARYLESRTSETQTQIFYNSVLGEAYSPEGSRITDDLIYAAQSANAYPSEKNGKNVAVGVDVGSVQHICIVELQDNNKLKLLRAFTVPTLEHLPDALKPYSPACVVIDSMPERQKAKEIQARLNRTKWELCWLALYPEMKDSIRWNKTLGMVDIHRTEILDEVCARFRSGSIALPIDISDEFKAHLRASVRVNEPDPRTGNMIGRWRESGPDHFAHALAYSVAASKRAASAAAPVKIEWL